MADKIMTTDGFDISLMGAYLREVAAAAARFGTVATNAADQVESFVQLCLDKTTEHEPAKD